MRFLFAATCIIFALTAFSSDTAKKDKTQIKEYESRAGFILNTYQPSQPDYSPENMAHAANRFLKKLNDEQRQSTQYELKSDERTKWSNSPARGEVGGLALGDLDEDQIRAFSDLLRAILSEEGYNKIRDIMLGDDLRSYVDGERNTGVGIEAFRFLVFGEPSAESQWAVQLDGHHIALNITLEGKAYSISPSFIGTFPQKFTVANMELRPLAKETELAFEFVNNLTPEQKALAVTSGKRGSMQVGARWDGTIPKPVGISCKLLDEEQKEKLLVLASQWFNFMPPAYARVQQEKFFNAIDETWFSWNGPLEAGSDISYTIQGPSIIIEYANSARGGSSGSNPADHVHTIYRDLDREYGGKL